MFKCNFALIVVIVVCCSVRCGVTLPVSSSAKPTLLETIKETVNTFSFCADVISSGLLKRLLNPIRLKLTFYFMGNGYYADSELLNFAECKNQFVIAEAIAEMWLKLDTMEKTNDVINKVMTEISTNFSSCPGLKELFSKSDSAVNSCNILSQCLKQYPSVKFMYEQLEIKLKEDPALYEIYLSVKKQKEKITEDTISKKYLDTIEPTWLNDTSFRKMVLNNAFLIEREDYLPSNNSRVLTKSILKLSKQPNKLDKIQAIYDEALDETVKTEPDIVRMFDLFFKNLEMKFEKDSALKEELENMKKEIANQNDWYNHLFDFSISSLL